MSESRNGSAAVPRAVIHKQILDEAESSPDKPMADLAESIPGATTTLVEQVLDEYGDPAEDQVESQPDADASPMKNELTPLDDIDERTEHTLRAIQEHPEASQRELAEVLDVSYATVNRRVNSIDGFDWENRQAFVQNLFGTSPNGTNGGGSASSGSGAAFDPDPVEEVVQNGAQGTAEDEQHEVADEELHSPGNGDATAPRQDLDERVRGLERQVAGLTDGGEERPGGFRDDPELVTKVVHACIESETVSREEELEIVRKML